MFLELEKRIYFKSKTSEVINSDRLGRADQDGTYLWQPGSGQVQRPS